MSRKKLETRNRILQTAWKLLETGSGSQVRISDIADAAGITRQALYLHFPKRADLLIATTKYLDQVKNVDDKLAASRAAKTGIERLDAFIDAWAGHIPDIYGIAKALLAMQHTDEDARLAWHNRIQAVREGCEAAVVALERDNRLAADMSVETATDILAMLLSVRNWEQLTIDRGWSQQDYVTAMKRLARAAIVGDSSNGPEP